MTMTDNRITPGTLRLVTVTGTGSLLPDGDYYATTVTPGWEGYHLLVIGTDDPRREDLRPWLLVEHTQAADALRDTLDVGTHYGWWVLNEYVTYCDDTTAEPVTFGDLAIGETFTIPGEDDDWQRVWMKTGEGESRQVLSTGRAAYNGQPSFFGETSPVIRVPLTRENGTSPAVSTDVTAAVTAERERLLAEFQAWKDRATETAHQYAYDNSLCGEFDRCMEEIGLPPREREYEVEIVQRYTVTVTANDSDHAGDVALELVDGCEPWERDVVEVSRA